MLNDLFLNFGIEGWKPALSALMLPPVPWLLLMLIGAGQVRRRPWWGGALLAAGAAAIWLSSTVAVGEALQRALLPSAPALSGQDLKDLRARRDAATAIVVLGGGRQTHAPEYGGPNLNETTMARLRYGLWLARETGLPVAFSGGSGHAQAAGPSEAEIAASIAARDFDRPLKWTESDSRDTRENARRTVALLQADGISRIVLVTHGWHLPRALRAFEQAIAQRGGGIAVTPAPMGLASDELTPLLRWLPGSAGFKATRQTLHEAAGLLLGA
jgi:uncharacterized SAM-binding protein YcdF (DUF218 family)